MAGHGGTNYLSTTAGKSTVSVSLVCGIVNQTISKASFAPDHLEVTTCHNYSKQFWRLYNPPPSSNHAAAGIAVYGSVWVDLFAPKDSAASWLGAMQVSGLGRGGR